MSPPPVRPIVINFGIDETEKLIMEEIEESPSEKHEAAEPAPFPYTPNPQVLPLPIRSTFIARIRYTLVVLNTIVPFLLDCTGIFPTRGLLTVGACLFAGCAVWQYRRDTARTKADATQATNTGDANAIAQLNAKILRQLRCDVIGAWVGVGTWMVACAIWVAVEIALPKMDIPWIADYIVAISALEAVLCVVLAVMLNRHRRAAYEEVHGRAVQFV